MPTNCGREGWKWPESRPMNTSPFHGPSHESKGVSKGFGERLLVFNQCVVCGACCLKPPAIHVKPRERIRRALRFGKQLLAIESIAGVVTVDLQDHAESRHTPFSFHCGERNDVHLLCSVDDHVKLLRAVHADGQSQLDVGRARWASDERYGRADLLLL